MTLKVGVTFDENLVTPRRHKQLMNLLLRREMEKHRDQRLMKHFALGANRKYGYKPITAGYAIKKKKIVHHLIPMVFTGRLKNLIGQTSKVTATATRARLYAKGYFPMPDEFRAQIEIVLPSEVSEMCDNIGRNYVMLVNTSVWGRKRSRRKP